MRKVNMIKELFFTVSKSFTLNFILAILIIIGFIFNFGTTFFKVTTAFLALEILFVDANLFFKS